VCIAGVYLSRHADIIEPGGAGGGAAVRESSKGYLILFKVIKGRVKSVVEKHGDGDPLDPRPDADCLQSTKINVDLTSVSHKEAFESTQVPQTTPR